MPAWNILNDKVYVRKVNNKEVRTSAVHREIVILVDTQFFINLMFLYLTWNRYSSTRLYQKQKQLSGGVLSKRRSEKFRFREIYWKTTRNLFFNKVEGCRSLTLKRRLRYWVLAFSSEKVFSFSRRSAFQDHGFCRNKLVLLNPQRNCTLTHLLTMFPFIPMLSSSPDREIGFHL